MAWEYKCFFLLDWWLTSSSWFSLLIFTSPWPPNVRIQGLAFQLASLPNLITAQGFRYYSYVNGGFPGSSDGQEPACNAGDLGLIPGLGRSPGEGSGNPFQYSCLENSMDRPWGRKELDMTEQLTPSLTPWSSPSQNTGQVAVAFSRGSSQPRDWTQVSRIAGRFFTIWATREAQEYWNG